MDSVTQGTLVAERYRLIRAIGFGGMGTVWLAYDQALDSPCAVKLIGATQARQEEFRIRFECEAKCAAQLRGSHVVDVLNRGQWQGKPFIVMEYMEGEDLAVRLERVGRLDETTTYRVVAHVARALMRAHALGIVHRDIKPGNIFLAPGDDQELAKLFDFGVAQHRALPNAFERPSEGSFIGTPCYMSPEQARGEQVDFRSDLWALAVIVFECLTGELPFQDEQIVDLVAAITRGPVPSLLQNRPDLPPAIEAWWQRATARRRELRFQSAKEFADALADALGFARLPVAYSAHAQADAPTVFDPLGVSVSPRVALAARNLAPRSPYDSEAAVTIYSGSPTTGELAAFLPGYGRRRSPYFVAATALCAALALAATVWRPALADMASGFGLESQAKSMTAQAAAMLPGSTEPSVGEPSRSQSSLERAQRAVPQTAAATAAPPVVEPTVTVAPVSAAAGVNAPPTPPFKPAALRVHKPNPWWPAASSKPLPSRAISPPEPRASEPARSESASPDPLRTEPLDEPKDYGI